MMVLAMIMVFMATGLFLPGLIRAGGNIKIYQIPPTWSQKLPASERFVLVLETERNDKHIFYSQACACAGCCLLGSVYRRPRA